MGEVIAWNVSLWKEKDFQRFVIDLAHANDWWVYHNPDSRRSSAGWPDLVLVREPECLFVELKTEKGRIAEQQQTVLKKLSLCQLETYIWRPRDMTEIHARLTKGPSCSKDTPE